METVRIDEKKCTLCGLCVSDCVRDVLEEGEQSVRVANPEDCIRCGHCKAICPVDALEIPMLDASEFEPAPRREDYPEADDLFSFFRARRSIRQFEKRPVEREKLERIIQAGRFAPTGGNRQGVNYTVVHTPEKLSQIRDTNIDLLYRKAEEIERAFDRNRQTGEPIPQDYRIRKLYVSTWETMKELMEQGIDRLFYHAPALVVLHLNPALSTSAMVDAGLAAMQMALMAEALELGTCFCGFLVFAVNDSPEFKKILNIPEKHIVPVSFVVGYPAVTYELVVDHYIRKGYRPAKGGKGR
ncbi:MAG TPA: nitroreductase family protein [Syntrophales bacterium]|nr:nitroreductase family protein [Syntrophales bacterium]